VVSTGWAGTTTGESAVSREWLFATTKSYRPINYLTPLVGEVPAAFVAAQRSNLVRHAFEFAPRPVQKSQQMSA
jgi:hypothetical protein